MFGRLFRRRPRPAPPELGHLGTRAFVVTPWEPGPTSTRPTGTDWQPPRTAPSTHGPLVLTADQDMIPFQGGSTPAPGEGVSVHDYIESFAAAVAERQGGYPS